MRTIFVFALLVAVALAGRSHSRRVVRDRSNDLALFQQFQTQFGKHYATPKEYNQRLRAFSANLDRIAALNKLENQDQEVFGVNQFADLTPREFKAKYLTFHKDPANNQARHKAPVIPPIPAQSIPVDFNWSSAITKIKNQGQCGSCWAFSTTEQVESMVYLKHKPQSIVKLSPQQIVDCDKTDAGCDGGDTVTAYEYLIKAGGQEDEKDYPYTAKDGKCEFDEKKVAGKISAWSYVTTPKQKNETQVLYYVATTAPVSICADAASWQYYTKGIITKGCGNNVDHCIQITGYGTDTKSNIAFWQVRNSWGESWGENGFLYIERNKNLCDLASEVTTVTAD